MNTNQLDLNLLKAFRALYRDHGVTRAARSIGLSQPAMSNALARLRHQVGDPLFVRTSDGMEPTARARSMAPEIVGALEAIETALRAPAPVDPAQLRRTLRIGLTDYGSILLQPPLAARLAGAAPLVDLHAQHSLGDDALESLDTDRLDVVLNAVNDLPARFVRRPFVEEGFVVIARRRHPRLQGGRLSLTRYLDLDHVLVSFAGDARGVADTTLAGLGKRRRIAVTAPHFVSVPAIVAQSDLIATVPSRIAQRFEQAFGLDSFDPPFAIPGYTSSLIWHRRNDNDPAHTWFREQILEIGATL